MDRNNEIFLLWELTAIFTQTLWTNFVLFCPPTWQRCKPPIRGRSDLVSAFVAKELFIHVNVSCFWLTLAVDTGMEFTDT